MEIIVEMEKPNCEKSRQNVIKISSKCDRYLDYLCMHGCIAFGECVCANSFSVNHANNTVSSSTITSDTISYTAQLIMNDGSDYAISEVNYALSWVNYAIS